MSPAYRLYCLDRTGRISFAEWIDADADAEAVGQARALKNGAIRCEVWEAQRLVAVFGADGLDGSPAGAEAICDQYDVKDHG